MSPPTSCRRVRQTGAVLGFLSGLATVAWIGFGGPKPPAPVLPVSTANCSSDLVTSHHLPNMTSPDQEEAPEYFYLYRISYAWTSAIGFLITVLVGIITGGFRRGTWQQKVNVCSGEVVRLIPVCWPEEDVHPSLLASCVRPRPAESSGELRLQFRCSQDLSIENKAVC